MTDFLSATRRLKSQQQMRGAHAVQSKHQMTLLDLEGVFVLSSRSSRPNAGERVQSQRALTVGL